ncbi:MAG: hypothetical protein ACPGVD_10715, partial [Flavobacteriales bacterium]
MGNVANHKYLTDELYRELQESNFAFFVEMNTNLELDLNRIRVVLFPYKNLLDAVEFKKKKEEDWKYLNIDFEPAEFKIISFLEFKKMPNKEYVVQINDDYELERSQYPQLGLN